MRQRRAEAGLASMVLGMAALAAQPAAAQPVGDQPFQAQSVEDQSFYAQSDAIQSDAVQPDAAQPDAGRIVTAQLDAARSSAARSDAARLYTAEAEEIIVTADRRARPLVEAPVFGVGLDADAILDLGVIDARSLFDALPGAQFRGEFSPRSGQWACGGLSQVGNGPPPCAILIDGVPVWDTKYFGAASIFNAESVVYTTGPLGAFAPNSLAGVIAIETKRPGDEREGDLVARAGENGYIRVQGGAGGPVAEDLGLRVDAFYERSDGRNINAFLNAPIDFIDGRWGVSVRGVYTPAERVEIDLKGRYARYNEGSWPFALLLDDDGGFALDPNVESFSIANRLGRSRGRDWGLTARVRVDLDDVVVSTITDWSRGDEFGRIDNDGANPGLLPDGVFGFGGNLIGFGYDLTSFFQDVRVSRLNDENRRFGWDVGGSIIRGDEEFPATGFIDSDPSISFDDILTTPGLVLTFFTQDTNFDATVIAAYASFDLDVTERLNLAASVRYEEDKREQLDRVGDVMFSDTFEFTPWKVTASYDAGPVLFFGSYGDASRAGGFNSPGAPPFGPETLRRAEGGFRAALAGGRANVSALGYCGWVEDYQIFNLVIALQVISNVPEARICGAEGSLDVAVTDRVGMYANFTLTRTKITDDPDNPERIGNRLPNTFNTILNFGANGRQPLGGGLELVGSLNARRLGESTWDRANRFVQGPSLVVDLRVGIEAGNYGLYAFAENVTDAFFYENVVTPPDNSRPFALGALNRRRLIGAELRAGF